MNYKQIAKTKYIVKNQEGFYDALYDYYNMSITRKKIKNIIQNVPIKYPCKITVIDNLKINVKIKYYNWLYAQLVKITFFKCKMY